MGQNLSPAGIRPIRLTYLTGNLDSETRSFVKKGFRIKEGKREPGGVFSNIILLQDGSQIILETTISSDLNNWRFQALKKYKNSISGIVFEVESIDSLYNMMKRNNIPLQLLATSGKSNKSYRFALDSCAPLDVVFLSKDTSIHVHSPEFDSLSHHRNNVSRFDWMLLSVSPEIESWLRRFFEIIGARKMHEGCCDFWRVGPPDDFCFFRFDPMPPKAKGKKDWLSIEPDGVYFAY